MENEGARYTKCNNMKLLDQIVYRNEGAGRGGGRGGRGRTTKKINNNYYY